MPEPPTPTHVRLPVMIDAEHPERCSSLCPSSGNMDFCHAFQVYRVRRDGVRRDATCVAATAAEDARSAVVDAAKRKIDVWKSGSSNGLMALSDAVDALRAIEGQRNV